MGQVAKPNRNVEKEYFKFCDTFNISPLKRASFGQIRKFWDLTNLKTNVYGDLELPEGRERMIKHIIRERNPRLRQQAINNFLIKNETVHCEACKFDFEMKYGVHGRNFIECHHTIPLSKMKNGQKTKSEDLVLLCSNCHRMIHRNKNWLTLLDLKKLIRI